MRFLRFFLPVTISVTSKPENNSNGSFTSAGIVNFLRYFKAILNELFKAQRKEILGDEKVNFKVMEIVWYERKVRSTDRKSFVITFNYHFQWEEIWKSFNTFIINFYEMIEIIFPGKSYRMKTFSTWISENVKQTKRNFCVWGIVVGKLQ